MDFKNLRKHARKMETFQKHNIKGQYKIIHVSLTNSLSFQEVGFMTTFNKDKDDYFLKSIKWIKAMNIEKELWNE